MNILGLVPCPSSVITLQDTVTNSVLITRNVYGEGRKLKELSLSLYWLFNGIEHQLLWRGQRSVALRRLQLPNRN